MVNFFKTAAGLENRNGTILMAGHELREIAAEHEKTALGPGTPVHVMNLDGVRGNYRRLERAIQKQGVNHRILYAMKANSHSNILKALHGEGANIDSVSVNEAKRALLAGVSPEKIMFTGALSSPADAEWLLKKGITINMDSLDDLDEVIAAMKKTRITPKTLSFRLNGEFGAGHSHHVITGGADSQFGIWEDRMVEAYQKAQEAGVKNFGMHLHIGSGVLKSGEFLKAAQKIMKMAKQVREKTGIKLSFIDFGGGIGVPYKPRQEPLDLDGHFSKLCSLFKQKVSEYDLGNPVFTVEPGRFLVCDAEVMLARVRAVKQTPEKNFARTDLSMNNLVRHAMYGSYHHILVDGKAHLPAKSKYTVTGTICETGDRIATDRKMPKLEKGDLLVVLNTGAYGHSMSSQYNSRLSAPIIFIDKGKIIPGSKAGTVEDLVRHEVA